MITVLTPVSSNYPKRANGRYQLNDRLLHAHPITFCGGTKGLILCRLQQTKGGYRVTIVLP